MPDISSAPGVPSPSGLYPQPPSQGGALSDPTRLIGLMESITRNQMLQNDLKARAAVGKAYQGALTPDGIDPQKFRAGILNNPDALWAAPEALQQGQTLTNTQIQTLNAQRQIISSVLGGLPPNPTKEQLFNAYTTLSRMGIPATDAVGSLGRVLQAPNKSVQLGIERNVGMSPSEQSERVDVIGPGGERLTVPKSEANTYPGAVPTSLSPDQQKSVEKFGQDKIYAGQYSQRILPMQEAIRSIDSLVSKYGQGVFGPGASGRKEFEGFLQTLNPAAAKKIGIEPQDLAEFAKAKKYLTQAMSNRNVQLGGHSDQQLAATVSGSPNVDVTDLALPDLAKTAAAAMRAEQAQIQEGFKSGQANYTDSLSKWPARNDVRAFALDLMPPDERAKFIKSLTPAERSRVNNSLRSAYEGGIIDRPSKAPIAAPTAAPRTAPAKPTVPPKPPVTGVQLGARKDGSPGWFIPDPSRPGKHMEVTLPGLGQ